MTVLVPGRETLLPGCLGLRKRWIAGSQRYGSGVAINHAIHDLIDIGEREFAFGSFVFATVKRLIISRLFGVSACLVSAGDVPVSVRRFFQGRLKLRRLEQVFECR